MSEILSSILKIAVAFGIALACFVVFFVLLIILCFVASFFVTKKEYEKQSKFYRWIVNTVCKFLPFYLGYNVRVEGGEKLPDGRFLLVANHCSMFDPLVIWNAFPEKDISFISKPENIKIPFFGKIATRVCCLSIDRENPRNAITTINKAAELLKNDVVSIGVYPEGTRNKGMEPLLPFHNGVFKIAQKANVPIVVAVTEKTQEIKGSFLKNMTNVKITICEVIPSKEIVGVPTADIAVRVQQDFLSVLDK